MNKILTASTIFVITAGLGISASAVSRTVRGYNVTLPRQGASTSGYAVKANNSKGINNNSAIGGNKHLNTAIRRTSNNTDITPVYTLTPGSRIALNYKGGGSAYRGAGTTLSLSSKLGNLVRIQAQGSWSPDE